VSGRDDDERWRSIVDNYGERARLDDDGSVAPPYVEEPEQLEQPTPFQEHDHVPEPDPDMEEREAASEAEDRFVPPPPAPLPRTSPLRLAAWTGVLGAPLAMLVLAVLGLGPPTWLVLAICFAFVTGFVYLISTMGREPRDPWDDGAVV